MNVHSPNEIGMAITLVSIVATALFIIYITFKDAFIGDKNDVKSFIIKVRGSTMTDTKFGGLTTDVNWMLNTSKLTKASGKELTPKNIISITEFPGEDCHYFVVWFRLKT